MYELCQNMVLWVVHFQIECHLLIICKYLLVMETPQGSDWDAYCTPLIPVAPGFSWQCDLGRWRSLEPCFALCAKIIWSFTICNYVASTALKGIVFAFWLFFPCIFINYCDYRVNHREFLWLVVTSQCQMSSDINILYHNWFILPGMA